MTLSGPLAERVMVCLLGVLIPLLVDDPLWAINHMCKHPEKYVLIPLLVDDPLWALQYNDYSTKPFRGLNPSFSG